MVLLEHILDLVQSAVENKNWNNHENTFEESLRRELLSSQKENNLLKEDLKQMTNAYYKLLKERNKWNTS